MLYIGIDPGKSGAIVVLDEGDVREVMRLSETEHDIGDFVGAWATHLYTDKSTSGLHCTAIIEQVHAMPGNGVTSMFKFGQSYGFCRGLLVANGIPFETVTPAKWQGVMQCRSKGDKNITKAAAQRLFPQEKIIHATADAFLLAEYCRRLHQGRNTDAGTD